MADEQVQVRRVSLLEADFTKTVFKGWCGKGTTFEVIVTGPFSAKEGAALLRLLATQIEVIADESTADAAASSRAPEQNGGA